MVISFAGATPALFSPTSPQTYSPSVSSHVCVGLQSGSGLVHRDCAAIPMPREPSSETLPMRAPTEK